jgi:head-tail adaptor
MPPLTAGAMSARLQLQSLSESVSVDDVVTPTWTDVATVWAQPKDVVLIDQLVSDHALARQRRTYAIRKRALTLPLRVLDAGRTMFAIAAVDDEVFRDQTVLTCVDGLNMTAGSGGAFGSAETATLYRGTDTRQTDGSSVRTWASTTTGLALLLEDADATILARLFGHETTATIRGIVPIEKDVRLDDGITITAGRHKGQRFLVTARKIDPELPAQAYYSLGLALTAEAFV